MIGKNIRTIRSVGSKVLFLVLLYSGCVNVSFAQNRYINNHKTIADSLSKAYGIPSSVILGIAILESGNGTSRNSKLLHNHFGIVGSNKLKQSHGIKSRYKQYNTSLGSFIHFCKVISNKYFYSKLKGSDDATKWVDAISKAGYSTHPQTWKTRILKTISRYNL
ncbi:glucosaminidase domain-containing protein [Olivibacter domesticus]|uniref:Flagellum-specific peptidoglycan hydrolase FlgJ n=1 Tax=Olivibacter domesticus TaxID=407022 RepID=A0A1H7HVR8_OLID1|nr:glucosaminidase domain-containing protein [Olivibacter domesticus]SEK53220.1 Flagellum-specific peptidoglycan hydrolase FlgJ [Olivibacter domesticus]